MTLLTVQEVAALIKARPKTIYQWAGLGQIPCFKINGCLRFSESEVLAWINSFKKPCDAGYNSIAKLEAREGGRRVK